MTVVPYYSGAVSLIMQDLRFSWWWFMSWSSVMWHHIVMQ